MMADWTEDEKREFEEYRRQGREDAEREAARSEEYRRKGREDAEREAASIHERDLVDTPNGPGIAVEEREGGVLVKLEADLPPEGPGTSANWMSRQGAFFVPLDLLRKRK
jgi:hypothetical protein